MLADRLGKAWVARRESTAINALMRFSDEGLVLGAGTVLAPAGSSARDISIDPLEPRLHALLAAAHLRRPAAGALAHLRKAAARWSEGDDGLAAMHLVLSQLDRLKQPETDAHRLFLADGLLSNGIEAGAVIDAIESGAPTLELLHKFTPDQPRVPAGSGRTSGQWTSTGAASQPMSPPSMGEVNPGTVTPVAGHKANSDAGHIAMLDCYRHVAEDAVGPYDNDNWVRDMEIACRGSKQQYDEAEFAVETNPKVTGGVVGFPDGGLIIMRKGKDDIYIPAVARGGPFRRSI